MAYPERRQLLNQDSTARTLWYIILVVTILNTIYGIYSVIRYFQKNGVPEGAEAAVNFTVSVFILIVLLQILYIWGMVRLARWVRILMWIGFIGSIVTFDLFGVIITGFALFSYLRILKTVYPKPSGPTPVG